MADGGALIAKAPWEGKEQDREARCELPSTTRALDIVQPSACYQQEAWTADYSEYTKPSDAYVGWGCSRLPGAFGEGMSRTRRLDVSYHKLYAP